MKIVLYLGIKLYDHEYNIDEPLDKMYHVLDYKGKRVLDVGGYHGETALLFLKWGASHVTILEPVPENVELIKRNAKLNGVSDKITILPYGVSIANAIIPIHYEIMNGGFGILGKGPYVKLIHIRHLDQIYRDVLPIDIAKFDCEGGERYLPFMDVKLLTQIPDYVIELHSKVIDDRVTSHFVNNGYTASLPSPYSSLANRHYTLNMNETRRSPLWEY